MPWFYSAGATACGWPMRLDWWNPWPMPITRRGWPAFITQSKLAERPRNKQTQKGDSAKFTWLLSIVIDCAFWEKKFSGASLGLPSRACPKENHNSRFLAHFRWEKLATDVKHSNFGIPHRNPSRWPSAPRRSAWRTYTLFRYHKLIQWIFANLLSTAVNMVPGESLKDTPLALSPTRNIDFEPRRNESPIILHDYYLRLFTKRYRM